MAQYIPKDALLAEIERLKGSLSPNFYEYDYDAAKVELLEKIEKFLNTLEVKEVDLKQSYRKYINNTYNEEFAKSILDANIKGDLDDSDLFGIMCYGFELGLTVSNKA